MKKNEPKTKKNTASVSKFLNSIEDEVRRKDSKEVLKIFKEVTKEKPVMWGTSIVGFGTYHYKYASGREGDWMRTGFSPRKQNLTIYIMPGYTLSEYKKLLKELGPHTLGKSCLYIKRLEDIHLPTLKKIVEAGWRDMKKLYPNK